jgi:hypothetical protein
MDLAESLNLHCACTTLQPTLLSEALADAAAPDSCAGDLLASRPHLFSASPVFLQAADADRIAASVAALHRVAGLPAWRDAALARAPAIAARAPAATGAFMGYDFHLGAQGPRLIEINTNAGGALLHAAALGAHRGCCGSADRLLGGALLPHELQQSFVAMFRREWQSTRGDLPLRRIAIVDDAPEAQYLAPEFQLARQLFLSHGIDAVVADAATLRFEGGTLLAAGEPVDLVYNRLTDFSFSEPAHTALRAAYEADAVVVTPHPHAHAVHADKRNLVALSDDALLAGVGASPEDRALLGEVVPTAQEVTDANADTLWTTRRQWFFKPAGGYGGKAAYRGDKLTRRVWDDIRRGGFIAQALVPPSERVVPLPSGETARLRLDVRAYAFRGEVLLLAARTWAGQTTNFRTPGGGFSPVVVLPDPASCTTCLP